MPASSLTKPWSPLPPRGISSPWLGADADGIDGQALFGRRLFGGLYRIALEVFAVGDDDENLMIGRVVEDLHGLVDDPGDIGAALGDEIGIHRRQRLFERRRNQWSAGT